MANGTDENGTVPDDVVFASRSLVAGVVKSDPDAIKAALSIDPEAFPTQDQKRIIREARIIQSCGGVVDVASLIQKCGIDTVNPFIEIRPSLAPTRDAKSLHNAYTRRRIADKAQMLSHAPIEDIVQIAEDIKDLAGDMPARPAVNTVCIDDVDAEAVKWLWHGRIAYGKITVVDGDPGLGKTCAMLDIAARVSRGAPMPNEVLPCKKGIVAILSYEDSVSDTLRPRLEAHGADLRNIIAITGIPCEDGTERPVVLPDDIDALKALLRGVDLFIIDPFAASLSGKIDGNKDSDVRRVMHRAKVLAEELDIAIGMIRHLNKSGGGKAVYRGGGSIGIIGAARVGLIVVEDPENPDQRVLAVSKCNIAKQAQSLTFRITEDVVRQSPMIEWTGTVNKTANQLLDDHKPSPALAEASAFIIAELAEGPKLATEIYEAAEARGLSIPTVKRARKQLPVKTEKEHKNGGKWVWMLEGDQTPSTPTLDHVDHVDLLQRGEGDQGDQEYQEITGSEDDLLPQAPQSTKLRVKVPRVPRGVPKGAIFANEALNHLQHIPKDDPLRDHAFEMISDWITDQLGPRA